MNEQDGRVVTRRSFLAAGLAVGMGVVLAGCGGDDAPAETAATTAASGDFPLTMRHRYGSTTIPSVPQRVVTAGFNDADFALAVGVVPVGVANFIGPFPEETRSWAQDALGGARPDVVSDEQGALMFERIAALRPDLIVYYSYLEEQDYTRLSQIAPTVVEPGDGTRWPRHTLDVGRALGREPQARDAVQATRDRFAQARRDHPEFAGTTAALLFGVDVGSNYYLLPPSDPRVGLFTSLGFAMPGVTGEISQERVDLLDQDVIVLIGADPGKMEADALFQRLDAVRQGRVADLGGFGDEFAGALGFDSPLSLPTALDIAVPVLAQALAAG